MAMNIQEYLVSLGVKVEDNAFAKLDRFLNSTKFKVGALSASLVALTKTIISTSISLDKESQRFDVLASRTRRSTDEIRAQETALKVLGKTRAEVLADPRLKAQYENLKKIGMELSLPKANNGILLLRETVAAWNELKFVGQYAMQWLNYHFLNKIQTPLLNVKNTLSRVSLMLRNDMPKHMERLATIVSYFIRLMEAGLHGGLDLIETINKLPEGIKQIGAALGAVFSMKALGSTGLIIAAIAGLLIILEDFYKFKENPEFSAMPEFWSKLLGGGLFTPEDIQGLADNITSFADSVTEKMTEFANVGISICEKISEGLTGFDWTAAGAGLGTVLSAIATGLLKIITNPASLNFAISMLMVAIKLCQGLLTGIGKALKTVKFDKIGTEIGVFIGNLFNFITEQFTADANGNIPIFKLVTTLTDDIFALGSGIIETIFSVLSGAFDTADAGQAGIAVTNIATSLIDILDNVVSKAFELLFGKEGTDEQGNPEYKDGVVQYLASFVKKVVGWAGEAVSSIQWSEIGEGIGGFISGLFKKIAEFLVNMAKNSEGGGIFEDVITFGTELVSGIITAISSMLSSISETDVIALADSIFQAISRAVENLTGSLKGNEFGDAGLKIGEAISKAITIAVDFLGTMVNNIWTWLDSGGASELFDIGTSIIGNVIDGIMSQLTNGVGRLIFGDEEWNSMMLQKQFYDANTKAFDVNGNALTSEQYSALSDAEKKAALERGAENDPYQRYLESVGAYGFAGYNPLDYTEIGSDSLRGSTYRNIAEQAAGTEIRGFMPAWWKEYKLRSSIVDEYENAWNRNDYEGSTVALARMRSFIDNWNNGVRGEELQAQVDLAGQMASSQKKVDTAAQGAVNGLNSVSDAAYDASQNLRFLMGESDTPPTGNAYGGRFDTATYGQFGEDGTEYIIPITKPNRAKSLILQMLSEMGAGAGDILSAFGVPSGYDYGGMASTFSTGIYPSSGSVKSNSDNNISVPTTINVYGSGDPVATGQAAARANESNILRRVQGVFA